MDDGRSRGGRSTASVLLVLATAAVLLATGGFLLWYRSETATLDTLLEAGDGFTRVPLEVESYDLNDIGVADVDGDALLDIFTTNHSARQSLLLNRGSFVFSEIFASSGLSQTRSFPDTEDAPIEPLMDKPGLYLYRHHRWLVLQAVDLEWSAEGSVMAGWPFEVRGDMRGIVERQSTQGDSLMRFALSGNDRLEINGEQNIIEFPHRFVFTGKTDLTKIFIGLARSNPPERDFVLEWRDRHSQVWGDFSGDGVTDVFVTRGGVKGQATLLDPPPVDELLLGDGGGRFVDASGLGGFVKQGCPARQTQRVDANADDLLDVHIVCGRSGFPEFPDQLWLQGSEQHYENAAAAMGLAAPEMSVGVWFDVDDDRDADYVAEQEQGLYLYRNTAGNFEQTKLAEEGFRRVRAHVAADIEDDGDIDVLSIGKRGSVLLENRGGHLVAREPGSVGLPNRGESGNFVDIDNDGIVEFHDPLAGLFRRAADGSFVPSGELLYRRDPERVYQANCTWFDADGDGAIDALCGFIYHPSLPAHWFEERVLGRQSSRRWTVELLRNERSVGDWLQLDLRGGVGNPEAIGAKVVITHAGRAQSRHVGSAEGALFSQGHYRLYFGLGEAGTVEELRVEWPDGENDVYRDVPTGKRYLIERSGTIAAH